MPRSRARRARRPAPTPAARAAAYARHRVRQAWPVYTEQHPLPFARRFRRDVFRFIDHLQQNPGALGFPRARLDPAERPRYRARFSGIAEKAVEKLMVNDRNSAMVRFVGGVLPQWWDLNHDKIPRPPGGDWWDAYGRDTHDLFPEYKRQMLTHMGDVLLHMVYETPMN